MQLFRLILPLLDKHHYNYSPLMISIINHIGLIIQHLDKHDVIHTTNLLLPFPRNQTQITLPGHPRTLLHIPRTPHRKETPQDTSQDIPGHPGHLRTSQDTPGHSYTSPGHTPHPEEHPRTLLHIPRTHPRTSQDTPGHPRTLLHIPRTHSTSPGHLPGHT